MDSVIMVVPILPGKTEATKKYFETLKTKKWKQFRQSEENLGIEREEDFLQVTPNGDFITMYVQAKDINAVFEKFAASQSPIDVYLKNQIKKLTGVDMNQPSTEPLPPLLLKFEK
jgi:hypothetical protein